MIVHALLAQPLDFADKRMRIDHDAVADDRQLARPHDARGQQGQLIGLAVDDERVAGIVAALEAHHDIGRGESQSTILPLPSSPHWAPITATFAMDFCLLR